MEKPSKLRNKLLKFLVPHAIPAITFQSPPLSPKKPISGKGSSVPIISMIPLEVRRKHKTASFDTREPTSPKVSCMGRVNNKKKKSKAKRVSLPAPQEASMQVSCPEVVKKNKPQEILKVFKGPKQGEKKFKTIVPDQVPSLGHIKRFSSGRGALSNFDWMTQGAVVVPDCQV
ncbi:hypothetical protein FCV25MIE_06395 [Fagus crenata]